MAALQHKPRPLFLDFWLFFHFFLCNKKLGLSFILCSQQVLTLVTPFTKLLFTCKALLHTLVKYCFVELILQDYFFLYLSFFSLQQKK